MMPRDSRSSLLTSRRTPHRDRSVGDLVVARRSPRRTRAPTRALESETDEGDRRRPPQERPRRRRAPRALAARRSPAQSLDPADHSARGARTHPPSHPTRLAPRRDPQSSAGDARAPQPAADLGPELAHAARPARVAAAGLGGAPEPNPRGLWGAAAHARCTDPTT